MGKQLVVSGNRILSYGEDCFLSMGGTVICPETSKVFQNATVVNCDYLPSDIDTVGYEYHAGEFVPCAPFGVGSGNVAVVCGEDCKTIKDSGIPLESLTSIKLLWENASPGSTFAAQTVSLVSGDPFDTTNNEYKFLICETSKGCFIISSSSASKASIEYIDNTLSSFKMHSLTATTTYEYISSLKEYWLAINFSYGREYTASPDYGVSVSNNATTIIPLRIYGVKI